MDDSLTKYLASIIVVLLGCVCGSYTQDGPDFITLSSQTEYVIRIGDSVSLICGFNLTSSPSAPMYTDIIWLSPSGSLIKYGDGGQSDNGHHYSADYGPDIVRLNIVNVTMMDDGRWNCTVPAMDREQHCDTVLLEIQLTVVFPPSQPLNLTAESVSYFWVAIQWQPPNDVGSHGISYYNVTVYRIVLQSSTETLIMELSTHTKGGETRANITGLQPGMTFQIQVAGISNIAGSDFTVVGESSASLQVNTSIIPAPMPICNSEPRLITSTMNSNNITFVLSWTYSQNIEGLHLSRVTLSYSIPVMGHLGQVSTRAASETLLINQTSKMISISSMNVIPGAFVVNITASNSQHSNTVMCPPLHLELNIIQLVLKGVQDCSIWVLHDAVEKQQAILSHFQGHIQNSCDGCEYSTTNQAMECTHENNEVVLLRAELFSPPNITEHVLNSLRSWIHIHSTGGSIVVQGLRLYPERDCPLIVESFGSPLNCYQTSPATSSSSTQTVTQIISTGDHPRERYPNAVTEGLAIIGLLGCGILTLIVLVLVLYVGYQRYKKNCQKAQRLRTTGHQHDDLQIPMVTVNRLNTTSNISIPETIPECEFEECENFDKDEFELSTSLAYGAVDSATVTASRLRLGSDLGSIISEDLEHTYHNPIYESNPIYETIKVKRTTVDSRPNSSVDECESSDHS